MAQDEDTWDPTVYEPDVRPGDVDDGTIQADRVAVIRTSDRGTFRRCRRRWGLSSHLRYNLGPIRTPAPLWVGVGFHFALEDFHAYHHYRSAQEAFAAYAKATYDKARDKMPPDWKEQGYLAVEMLKYYEEKWLVMPRDPLRTFIFDGIPQVEVTFNIEVPIELIPQVKDWGYDRVVYSGTIDRVIIDDLGRLWIVEYKTAKMIQTLHFANDSQVSTYCWAGQYLYGQPIVGVVYQQHRKAIPEPPGATGGHISVAKNQITTRALYKQALLNLYGNVEAAPQANVNYLNYLGTIEDADQDKFIRRDRVYRNQHQLEAEGAKILMEIPEMLNPNTPLYPSPTRDCAYLCPFAGPCVSMDDGSDWTYELQIMTEQRDRSYDLWRQYLPRPSNQVAPLLKALATEPPPLVPL